MKISSVELINLLKEIDDVIKGRVNINSDEFIVKLAQGLSESNQFCCKISSVELSNLEKGSNMCVCNLECDLCCFAGEMGIGQDCAVHRPSLHYGENVHSVRHKLITNILKYYEIIGEHVDPGNFK